MTTKGDFPLSPLAPSSPSKRDDRRWSNAVTRTIDEYGTTLQIACLGRERKTHGGSVNGHTCFARIRGSAGNGHGATLQDVVRDVLRSGTSFEKSSGQRRDIDEDEKEVTTIASVEEEEEATELLSIGAVWIISALCSKRGGAKSKRPHRATLTEATLQLPFDVWNGIMVRIHYRPIRYPAVHRYDWGELRQNTAPLLQSPSSCLQPGVILHENLSMGYAILDKPPGIPVHGYVYNAVENVVHAYGTHLRRRFPTETFAVSVPHRLDVDTSGVLIVATRSEFASYVGRLLEAGALLHADDRCRPSWMEGNLVNAVRPSLITKRYECLVRLCSDDDYPRLMDLATSTGGGTITHYLSSARTSPRIFKRCIPHQPERGTEGTTTDNTNTPVSQSSWLECRLRIVTVGPVLPVKRNEEEVDDTLELLGMLLGSDGEGDGRGPPSRTVAVARVEIELLTGRTHQIRGQMAALGFPLVNDSLYGREEQEQKGVATGVESGEQHESKKIALHCRSISFPVPCLVDGENKDGGRKKSIRLDLSSTGDLCTFRSGGAWWSKYIER